MISTRPWRFCAFFLMAFTIALCLANPSEATIVRFDTVLGNIDVRLFGTAAPESVDNFLGYVNRGDYTNTVIHRSVPGFIIQGGETIYDGTAQVEPANYPTVQSQPSVINEPGISNLRGTLAYAKVGNDPNSATNQWFFNLDDNSANLDFQNGGFTVFGQIVGDGLAVVDAIAALPQFPFQGFWNNGPLRNYTTAEFNAFEPVDSDNLVIINSVTELLIPEGDYNFDGLVDDTDLGIWAANFGSTLSVEADGNGNGIVDGGDFLTWQRTFGQSTALTASQAVPEPGSGALAAIAATALLLRRYRLAATR